MDGAAGAGDFRFTVEGAEGEPIAVSRLADLLRDLAALLGERGAVRLVGADPDTGAPVLRVEPGALPAVRERLDAVARGAGPADATRAFGALDERLRAAGLRARLSEAGGGAALAFPGRDGDAAGVRLRQDGSVDGEVVRVGGGGEEARILLRVGEDEVLADITAPRALARGLAQHLYEPVRLHGAGRWARLRGGRWVLEGLRVERFDPLDGGPVSEALAALRRLEDRWDGPDAERRP